jgi:hypothetical protein
MQPPVVSLNHNAGENMMGFYLRGGAGLYPVQYT